MAKNPGIKYKLRKEIRNPAPIPGRRDKFGGTVKLTKDYIIVSADARVVDGNAGAGAVYLFDKNGVLLRHIKAPEPQEDGRFGTCLADTGNALAVSEILWKSPTGNQDGRVLFYYLENMEYKLAISPEKRDLRFGRVATIGDNILASAQNNSYLGYFDHVYLYQGNANAPDFGRQLTTFLRPDTPRSDFNTYGGAVSGLSAYALVGAPRDIVGGVGRGAVYMFDADPWSDRFGAHVHTFHNPRPETGEHHLFGMRVAPIGSNVLISAHTDDTHAPRAGAAHLFDADPLSARFGELLWTFDNPTPDEADLFGWSIDGSSNLAVISSLFEDAKGKDAGAVYIFDADSSSQSFGSLVQTLNNPAGEKSNFGSSVSMLDDAILVGAEGFLNGRGAAYLFQQN